MDFSKQFETYAWPLISSAITGFVVWIFGNQKYKRESSATNVVEAQDTQQIGMMAVLREERREAVARAEKLERLLRDSQQALNNQAVKIVHLEAQGEHRDDRLNRQSRQLMKLAEWVALDRPDLAPVIAESGFLELDAPLHIRRRTDAMALPKPVDVSWEPTQLDQSIRITDDEKNERYRR